MCNDELRVDDLSDAATVGDVVRAFESQIYNKHNVRVAVDLGLRNTEETIDDDSSLHQTCPCDPSAPCDGAQLCDNHEQTTATALTDTSYKNEDVDLLRRDMRMRSHHGHLFNLRSRLVLVLAACNSGSYHSARARVSLPIHHSDLPQDHLATVVNLIPTDHRQHDVMTNLAGIDWRRMESYANHLCHNTLTRCCFQCGMLHFGRTMAAKVTEREVRPILVQNIRTKHDCRAYRTFQYYIERRVRSERRKLNDAGEICHSIAAG